MQTARFKVFRGQEPGELAQLDGVSVPPNASASIPSRTPADFSTDMAFGGSGYTDTIDPYPTRATCFADLRDHAIRLMERREGHGLRRCGDGQGKSNCDQPFHFGFSLTNLQS